MHCGGCDADSLPTSGSVNPFAIAQHLDADTRDAVAKLLKRQTIKHKVSEPAICRRVARTEDRFDGRGWQLGLRAWIPSKVDIERRRIVDRAVIDQHRTGSIAAALLLVVEFEAAARA